MTEWTSAGISSEEDRYDRLRQVLLKSLPQLDSEALTPEAVVLRTYEELRDARASLLQVICGDRVMQTGTGTKLDMESMSIAKRFFRQPAVSQLPSYISESVTGALQDVMDLGFILYAKILSHPTRTAAIDHDKLIPQWIFLALVADRVMQPFDERIQRAPTNLFKTHYRGSIEVIAKEKWELSFWQRGKMESFFRNVFNAGGLLILCRDMITDKPNLVQFIGPR